LTRPSMPPVVSIACNTAGPSSLITQRRFGSRCERVSPLASSISLFSSVPTTVVRLTEPTCFASCDDGSLQAAIQIASKKEARYQRYRALLVLQVVSGLPSFAHLNAPEPRFIDERREVQEVNRTVHNNLIGDVAANECEVQTVI
jgi:hypothetical protein